MIDTLAIARNLSEAGVEQSQAEAHAAAIANAVGEQHGETATKDFVDAKISALEARLVRWIVGTVFASAGLLFAALRFIP